MIDRLIEFEELESTNLYCRQLDARTLQEFTVIWAHNQTAGVGQRGNLWVSESGKNLTFSIILHPSFISCKDQYELTKILSLGVSDCLGNEVGNVTIKWPNDIYIGNKKVAGILIENLMGESFHTAICGIGINVNQVHFSNQAPNAISLKLLTNKDYDLLKLLDAVVDSIEQRYIQYKNNGPKTIDNEYLERLMSLNKMAQYLYHGEVISATINGVSPFGHLLLTTDKGTPIECSLKEIEIWHSQTNKGDLL